MLIEMLGPGTRADILQGNLGGFKGAIFENLMADTLHNKQQSLYYFLKDSGLELDFLVRMKGECVPLEVKAKTAQAKSVQTVLRHADKYHVKHVIKFGDFNVGREGQLLTLPNYMQFLLARQSSPSPPTRSSLSLSRLQQAQPTSASSSRLHSLLVLPCICTCFRRKSVGVRLRRCRPAKRCQRGSSRSGT